MDTVTYRLRIEAAVEIEASERLQDLNPVKMREAFEDALRDRITILGIDGARGAGGHIYGLKVTEAQA